MRWIQSTLNNLLNLNLVVSGIMDVQTRSAIRSFQEKQGLAPDGIVGPPTEAALIAASKGHELSSNDRMASRFATDTNLELEINHTGAPSWLVLLDHYLGTPGGVVKLEPAQLNPGFIDPVKDELLIGKLHNQLRDFFIKPPDPMSIHSNDYRAWLAKSANKLRVALVDLTGSKLYRPEFAGFHSTVPIYAASCSKLAAIYAAYQLRFDLNQLALSKNIQTKTELIRIATQRWMKIPSSDRPRLERVFFFQEDPPRPVMVEFHSDFQETLDAITRYPGRANTAVSTVIDFVGFHFIASVLWQSGLHHTKRGGLWLGANFRSGASRRSWRSGPVGGLGHGTSALSLVALHTLLAQNRLVDASTSLEMKDVLALTNSFVEGALTNEGRFDPATDKIYSKVGYWSKWVHDCALIERYHNGRLLRYALAVLTESPEYLSNDPQVLEKLIVDMDKLIVLNNP